MPLRPANILWITTDHMRYDCVGANGNAAMHTPNLDRLARHGVSFDGCYANSPLCMPSRCSFMTGCYPQQTGVVTNGQELPVGFTPTVADVLAAGGYRTSHIGKLHFQNHEDRDLDPRPRHAYGFDSFILSEEAGCYEDAYRIWLRGAYPELVDRLTVPRPTNPARRTESTDCRVVDAPWQASHSGWIAEQFRHQFCSWGTRPGLYHLGFFAPHPPLNPTREMFAPYDGIALPEPVRSPDDSRDPGTYTREQLLDYRRHFYALVTGVDLAIGAILSTLEETGMLDDTLVIFSSDHGDACGDHGRTLKGASYLESIMHLPLIWHWPAGFGTAGRRVAGLVEMVDVLPTLTELCGLPHRPTFRGRSYAAALLENRAIEARRDVYAFHGYSDIMLRTETHKYLGYFRGSERRELLFDLIADPHEMVDRHADPACADILAALRDAAFHRTLEASGSILPRTHYF